MRGTDREAGPSFIMIGVENGCLALLFLKKRNSNLFMLLPLERGDRKGGNSFCSQLRISVQPFIIEQKSTRYRKNLACLAA